MDGHDLDQDLDRLRAATERAGANLLELDQSPARALLGAVSLEGQSAACWTEATHALSELFQCYAALSAVMEAAVRARGSTRAFPRSRSAEIAHLVLGPSVELPERAIPMAERDLLSGSRLLRRCTPDALLVAMAADFTVARRVITSAAEAWDVTAPRLQRLREHLTTVVAESGPLERTLAAEVASLGRRLEEAEGLLTSDPLAYDGAAVDALDDELDALVAAVDGARQVRTEFDAEMAAARAALDALRQTEGQARCAQSDVAARVAGPTPLPSELSVVLADELDDVAELASLGEWRSVHVELTRWRRRLDEHRLALEECATAQRALLAQRRKLRGRLDAYAAKAACLGRGEHPDLERLRHEAVVLLYHAPTDLAGAETAVRRYQQALDVVVGDASGRAR